MYNLLESERAQSTTLYPNLLDVITVIVWL